MPRAKASKKNNEDEEIPSWVEDEIKNVKLNEEEKVKRTGYILDIYEKDNKLDIQVYEALPDGRTIVEGIDIPKTMNIGQFVKGVVYEFTILIQKGRLSEEARNILKTKFDLDMDYIFRFELTEAQQMDVESDNITDDVHDIDE